MRRISRSSLKGAATFCYVWLMLGFFSGTLVLLGPVRWLTSALRDRGYPQRIEDVSILGVIAVYVGGSALVSWWVVRRMSRCGARVRIAVPTLLTVAAALCLWGWMNPAHLIGAAPAEGSGLVRVSGAEFVFGPYPDRARLAQLKKDGYTAVVSLQHPAVVPFEPVGIAEEQKAARAIGLEFIHAPMLPWVSSNDAALGRIRAIAQSGRGRYYVHCGLGRDRVNVVKHMLETQGTHVAAADGFLAPQALENGDPFERGAVREVEKDFWLLPYPTSHEYFGKLLSGQVRHVILALDPNDETQRRWRDEGARLLTEHAVPFDVRPLRADDVATARAIVGEARRLPRPVAVVVGFMDPYPRSTGAAHTLLNVFESPRATVNNGAHAGDEHVSVF